MSAITPSTHDTTARGRDPGGNVRLRRRAVSACLVAIVSLIAMAFAPSAATADPWACDNAGYLSQFDSSTPETVAAGTALRRADRQQDDTYQLTTLGSEPAEHLNAIGFRPQDGLIYAWNNTTEEVVRIERDPVTGEPIFDDIGNPPGSGITSSVIGGVLADGTFLVWQGGAPEAGAIFDVSGPEAELVSTVSLNPASPAGFRGDFAVSPVDGQLYGVNPDNPADPNTTWGVYRFTLEGGVLTRGARVADGTQAGGGAWFQPDNTFIIYANGPNGLPPQGNGVYGVDLVSGQLRFLGTGPAFSNADGTACANGIDLIKDAEPRTVTAGTELTYSYTMTSRGLTDNPVNFLDTLPAGMTYVPGGVTVTPPFGTVNAYDGTNTLSISGTMSPNQSVAITARVMVSPEHPCEADVDNQAEATMEAPGLPPVTVLSDDPDTLEDPTDPTTVHVVCSADLSIEKSSTARIVPGKLATYTLKVTNNGPSAATAAEASDPLPKGVSFVSASSGCSEAGGTVTCKAASLAVGASQTFSVSVDVASSAKCSELENTATVTNNVADPNPGNNSSSVRNCGPESDLEITKTASSAKVFPGGQVMYTLVVKNNGPSDNSNVTVRDSLAAGLSLESAKPSQGSCSTAGGKVSCNLGNLGSGGSAQVLVTAKMTSSSACVKNTAEVIGDGFDPKQSNNRDDADVCPRPEPPPRYDVEIEKTASKKRILADGNVKYTVAATNNGPETAPGVKVTDTFNRRARLVSVKTTKGSCGKSLPISCSLGDIAAGGKATITVVVKPLTTGCSQRNAATVVGEGTDTNPANNLSSVNVCVAPKLTIVKRADRKSVGAGGIVRYEIRVSNRSKRIAAQNVRTCDRLPSGLALLSAKPKAKLSKGMPCWSKAVLKGGKSVVYRLTAKALRSASGRERNVATVRAAGSRGKAERDAAGVRVQSRAPRATPVTG